jgi:predicted HD superfamily hydrolase involved in NAD metabolism
MLERIKRDLKAKLSARRYAHTESVVKTALEFLAVYDRSAETHDRVEIAAWLHDCVKELKNDEQVDLAKFYGIEVHPEDIASPNLLHARNSAAFAEETYEIVDPRILNAIREHTLGAPEMCLEAKILYLADMLEPGRDAAIKAKSDPNASEINYSSELDSMRALALAGKIDEALLAAMNSKITYVIRKNQPIHPLGVLARNYLLLSSLAT